MLACVCASERKATGRVKMWLVRNGKFALVRLQFDQGILFRDVIRRATALRTEPLLDLIVPADIHVLRSWRAPVLEEGTTRFCRRCFADSQRLWNLIFPRAKIAAQPMNPAVSIQIS